MSCEGGEVKFDVTLDATKAMTEMMVLQRALNQTLRVVSRLSGGNEDLQVLIRLFHQTIAVITQVRIAFAALAVAQAGAGPLGWALFGLTVAGAATSYVDYVGSYG